MWAARVRESCGFVSNDISPMKALIKANRIICNWWFRLISEIQYCVLALWLVNWSHKRRLCDTRFARVAAGICSSIYNFLCCLLFFLFSPSSSSLHLWCGPHSLIWHISARLVYIVDENSTACNDKRRGCAIFSAHSQPMIGFWYLVFVLMMFGWNFTSNNIDWVTRRSRRLNWQSKQSILTKFRSRVILNHHIMMMTLRKPTNKKT